MNVYKPGQSVRFSAIASVLGALTDPSSLYLYVHGADASITMVPLVNDSLGLYHGDFVIPYTARPGVWWYRFYAPGSSPANSSLGEYPFEVQAKAF